MQLLLGQRMIFCNSVPHFRQTTEALLRYHLYVDCMPVHGVEGMSGEEQARVTRIASSSHRTKNERYMYVAYQWLFPVCINTQYDMYVHVLMRDEKEERKKQARSNKQTRQSNTACPRQSLFLRKMSCLGWDSNPRHSTL